MRSSLTATSNPKSSRISSKSEPKMPNWFQFPNVVSCPPSKSIIPALGSTIYASNSSVSNTKDRQEARRLPTSFTTSSNISFQRVSSSRGRSLSTLQVKVFVRLSVACLGICSPRARCHYHMYASFISYLTDSRCSYHSCWTIHSTALHSSTGSCMLLLRANSRCRQSCSSSASTAQLLCNSNSKRLCYQVISRARW